MTTYIWPEDNPKIRRTVLASLGILVSAKVLNTGVPFIFRSDSIIVQSVPDPHDVLSYAVDTLNNGQLDLASGDPVTTASTLITATLLGYGVARAGALGLNELRWVPDGYSHFVCIILISDMGAAAALTRVSNLDIKQSPRYYLSGMRCLVAWRNTASEQSLKTFSDTFTIWISVGSNNWQLITASQLWQFVFSFSSQQTNWGSVQDNWPGISRHQLRAVSPGVQCGPHLPGNVTCLRYSGNKPSFDDDILLQWNDDPFQIQAYSCGPAYAGVALATVTAYTVFTLSVTQWRTQFRVNMNKVGHPWHPDTHHGGLMIINCHGAGW